MKFSFRKLGKRFFILINTLLCLLFLTAALLPYWPPKYGWWLGFVGLIFPYLLLLVLLFIIFWLFAKPRYCLISILAIALNYKQVAVLCSLHTTPFNYYKKQATLRVMTWNVKIFEGVAKGTSEAAKATTNILNFIKQANPDVLCLQEFSQYTNAGTEGNHIKRIIDLGYPYYIFSNDYNKDKVGYQSGIIIFSKTPIIATQKISFNATPESIVYADILQNNADTLRVYTTHLQSFKFNKTDYQNLNELKQTGGVNKQASKNILVKMKNSIQLRGLQAQQIRPLLDSCPYPHIICGDFNDVPNSYTYWHIRGNKLDAFVEKGTGIGRSFISLAPTLRIDFLLCSRQFAVEQFANAYQPFSDHLPLIADFIVNKKN